MEKEGKWDETAQGQLAIRSYPHSFSLSRNRASPNKNVTNSGAKSFWVNTVWWRQVTPRFPIHGELRKAHWLAVTRRVSAKWWGSYGARRYLARAHTETRAKSNRRQRASKEGRESGRTKASREKQRGYREKTVEERERNETERTERRARERKRAK